VKTEFHPAKDRGHANHGWLNTFHSFSFATYFNPAREQFGCLRVLNDDTIDGGTGFGLHPHNNMEIITIMLEGALEHQDSMGNVQVISSKEIQVMSAGTGIYHAEYNHSKSEKAKLFQLWIFPREKGLTPRYDQKIFNYQSNFNQLITLITPDNCKEDGTLWIHQDAYISAINLTGELSFEYKIKIPGNGVYVMVIEGKTKIAGIDLGLRDAIGLYDTDSIIINSDENTKLLFIEVPMK
jgi:redox-sensitive bicupin YhaK (pirin superfamily)